MSTDTRSENPAPSDPLAVRAVDRVEHVWTVPDDGVASRRARRLRSGAYHSSVPAAIADAHLDVPADLAADAEDAAAALARLDATVSTRSGGTSSSVGPMLAVLLRTESASSSQIENITVGVRQLGLAELAELAESRSANARMVTGNVHAMEAALDLAHRLDLDAVLAMQRALLENRPGWQQHAGRYRDQLVWVGASSLSPVGARFVAPQPDLVPGALDDLIGFLRRDDLPVIVHAAIAHAQFETIHPFVDGNGRTGRALVQSMLRHAGILRHVPAPVSAGLLRDTDSYVAGLESYRAGDARPIVERFAEAARFAAVSGAELVDDLQDELDHSRELLAGLRPQSLAWRVLPMLLGHPVVNAPLLVRTLATSDVAVQRALSALTDRGVLTETTGRSRNRVWVHAGVVDVLEGYSERLRRR